MTDRIIPLPDGRFSVSREDLELFGNWFAMRSLLFEDTPDDEALAGAIDAALNKDTTDERT